MIIIINHPNDLICSNKFLSFGVIMKKSLVKSIAIIFPGTIALLMLLTSCQNKHEIKTGNVIFIHPDGTSVVVYNATRMLYYDPDREMNWE